MDGDFYMLFLKSVFLIIRAGFEAIIVISAICAYLKRTGQAEKIRSIYVGALVAIAASFLTVALVQVLFIRSGDAREAIEGITMLAASALLVFVGYWFLRMADAEKWHEYIDGKARGSAGKTGIFALSFTSFLTVYREGAETVIFYQALHSVYRDETGTIITGFLTGLALLAFVFLALESTVKRIPSGVFFKATTLLLYFISFTLAGHGIWELQKAGIMSISPVENMQGLKFLRVYPTIEGIAVQGALLVVFVAVLFKELRGKHSKPVSAG